MCDSPAGVRSFSPALNVNVAVELCLISRDLNILSMDGQEAFRKLANQLRNGKGVPGAPKGFFAGSGLLIAVVLGGFAINESLFNGALCQLSSCVNYSLMRL